MMRFFQFLLFTAAALVAAASPTTPSTINLIPLPLSHPQTNIRARDFRVDVSFLRPQSVVAMHYGSVSTTHTASGLFTAVPGHPIVLMSRLITQVLFITIDDNTNTILVTFVRDLDAQATLTSAGWQGGEGIVFVDEKTERAWMVESVDVEDSVVGLKTRPLDRLSDAFASAKISLGHNIPDNAELRKRQSKDTDNDGNYANTTLDFVAGGKTSRTTVYPLPGKKTSAGPIALQATCVGCHTTGTVLLQAGLDVEFNKSTFNPFDVQTAFVDLTVVEPLRAHAAIELITSAKLTYNITHSLLPTPVALSPILLGALLKLGPFLDLELALELSVSASANVTLGAVATVPSGARVRIDLVDHAASSATNWKHATIDPIVPSFANLATDVSWDVSVALRPSLNFGASVPDADADGQKTVAADVGLALDLPKLYHTGKVVANVSVAECAARNASTDQAAGYEFYPHALKLETGLAITLLAQAGAEVDIPGVGNMFDDFEQELWTHDWPLVAACEGFDPSNGTLGDAARRIDIPQLEAAVEKAGSIPEGVNASLLQDQGGLSPEIMALVGGDDGGKKAENATHGGSTGNTSSGSTGSTGSTGSGAQTARAVAGWWVVSCVFVAAMSWL